MIKYYSGFLLKDFHETFYCCDVSDSFTIHFQAFYLVKFTKIMATTTKLSPMHEHVTQKMHQTKAQTVTSDRIQYTQQGETNKMHKQSAIASSCKQGSSLDKQLASSQA